jgi:hypothetical protein
VHVATGFGLRGRLIVVLTDINGVVVPKTKYVRLSGSHLDWFALQVSARFPDFWLQQRPAIPEFPGTGKTACENFTGLIRLSRWHGDVIFLLFWPVLSRISKAF